MGDPTTARDVERARAAAARGDWTSAFDAFTVADHAEPLGLSDLPLYADAAYAAGHLETTIDAWERVHASSLDAGDRVGAAGAAVRVALHLLIDTGLLASVRGWVTRAERLLGGSDETPVHAWLAVVRMYERLLSGDFEVARGWAHRAIEIGTSLGEPAAAALGRVAEARCLIFEGDHDRGLALLDEAAVAALFGELDPLSAGILFCELLCACQGLGLHERAEEWTGAMERWRNTHGVGSLGGRCRVHRAELLRMRGACVEAEEEALLACEELRPYLRLEFGWPLTELGRIRLRMGDLDGAEEAFLAAHETGWDPQPGLSLLRLAQGDIAAAGAGIRDALGHPLNVPSKELPPNNELRRAPLLVAQVEIAIAAGDLARARWASEELDHVAASFESKALAAGAALSRGRVLIADGQAAAAKGDLHDALLLWSELCAPYEVASTRMALATVYRQEGNEDRALLESRAARSAFDRVEAVDHAARAARAAGDHATTDADPRPPVQPSEPSVNSFRREGDYWSILFEGRTARLRDLIGMRYISRLLAEPGREFHVLDLVAGVRPDTGSGARAVPGDAGEWLDARAKEAYRRRLAEIDEDLSDATDAGDAGRAARADAERDFLIRELSRAVGLTGRDRRAGDASERARASVTRAVRHAMARIAAHDPDLGDHLDRTIRTGTYCGYMPDPRAPAAWEF